MAYRVFRQIANWQRTKQMTLEFLERHVIGESNALQLTTAILIDHIRNRRAGGAGPATPGNDLTWIGCVLKAAKSVQGLPVAPRIVEEARTACRELRLIGKAKRSDRRPTDEELAKLFDFFGRRDQRSDSIGARVALRTSLPPSTPAMTRFRSADSDIRYPRASSAKRSFVSRETQAFKCWLSLIV
jgi:hypothetical protein